MKYWENSIQRWFMEWGTIKRMTDAQHIDEKRKKIYGDYLSMLLVRYYQDERGNHPFS